MEETKTAEAMPPEKRSEEPIVCDGFLQDLVEAANRHSDTDLPIILTVGGAVITGQVVGLLAYFEAMADLIYVGDSIEKEQLKRQFLEPIASELEQSKQSHVPPRMIHLKDVMIYASNTNFSIDWWRGRIETVDGFSVGDFEGEQL